MAMPEYWLLQLPGVVCSNMQTISKDNWKIVYQDVLYKDLMKAEDDRVLTKFICSEMVQQVWYNGTEITEIGTDQAADIAALVLADVETPLALRMR